MTIEEQIARLSYEDRAQMFMNGVCSLANQLNIEPADFILFLQLVLESACKALPEYEAAMTIQNNNTKH